MASHGMAFGASSPLSSAITVTIILDLRQAMEIASKKMKTVTEEAFDKMRGELTQGMGSLSAVSAASSFSHRAIANLGDFSAPLGDMPTMDLLGGLAQSQAAPSAAIAFPALQGTVAPCGPGFSRT